MRPRYCFVYGRPTAAGGIERPTTPATTTSVTTYGSARKSVVQAWSSPYAPGSLSASASVKPKSRHAANAAYGRQRPKMTAASAMNPRPARHVLVERVRDAVREVDAAEAGQRPRQDDGHVPDPVDGEPDRVGGLGMLADRTEAQAGRRPEEKEMRDHDERERDPDQDVQLSDRRAR